MVAGYQPEKSWGESQKNRRDRRISGFSWYLWNKPVRHCGRLVEGEASALLDSERGHPAGMCISAEEHHRDRETRSARPRQRRSRPGRLARPQPLEWLVGRGHGPAQDSPTVHPDYRPKPQLSSPAGVVTPNLGHVDLSSDRCGPEFLCRQARVGAARARSPDVPEWPSAAAYSLVIRLEAGAAPDDPPSSSPRRPRAHQAYA